MGLLGISLCQSVAELCPFNHVSNLFTYISTQHFACALIMTRSKLGSLCVDLRKFIKDLLTLIRVIISFPLNILSLNRWNLTKFSICVEIDEINVVIDNAYFFFKLITELWPLTQARISFPFNILEKIG